MGRRKKKVSLKTCTKCKKEKPVEDFGIVNNNMDGLNYRCKECVSEYMENYYRKNGGKGSYYSKEYLREHRKNNMATAHRNRVPQGAPNTLTDEEWLKAVDYFDGCDAYTGLKITELSLDHIISFSKGGGHEKKNIVPCDLITNRVKGSKDMEFWYRHYFTEYFSEERLAKIREWQNQ